MDAPIARAEYVEHNKRMDDEHHRINRRIEALEEEVREFKLISSNVERLATNMESMIEEQKKQGERLVTLEKGPGDTWNRIKSKALDTGVGLVCGAFFTGVILMIAEYIR